MYRLIRYGRLVPALLLVLVLVAVLAAIALKPSRPAASVFLPQSVERAALEILSNEKIGFLVTDRLVSQIVVESDSSNALFGKREGYLLGKARLYYGIDLAGLSIRDVVLAAGVLTVRLPEPSELDFAVDLDSLRFLSKRSGLMVIADWALDRDQEAELRRQFKAASLSYMRSEDLVPGKAEILARLNGFDELLGRLVGVRVVFE